MLSIFEVFNILKKISLFHIDRLGTRPALKQPTLPENHLTEQRNGFSVRFAVRRIAVKFQTGSDQGFDKFGIQAFLSGA